MPLSYIGRGALVRATVTQESFEKIKVDEDDIVVYDVWLIRRCSRSRLVLLMATDRIT